MWCTYDDDDLEDDEDQALVCELEGRDFVGDDDTRLVLTNQGALYLSTLERLN